MGEVHTTDVYIERKGGAIVIDDEGYAYFGDSKDAWLRWDGTDLDLGILTDSSVFNLGDGTTNTDFKVWGQGSAYMLWDESAAKLTFSIGAAMDMGVSASVTGSGITLSATKTVAFGVYTDDGNAAIGSGTLTRAGRFRNLETYTAGNREQEACGAIGQMVSVAGTNRHNKAGLIGSYEGSGALIIGGQIWTTDPWIQAGVLGRVGVGNGITTIDTYGVLAGLAAMSNTTAFLANNGTYAGVFVGKWAGTVDFDYGLFVDPDAVVRGIGVGTIASDVIHGVPILNATSINVFASDDNGADQTTGTVHRNVTARTYFSIDQTLAAADYHVLRGHLKAASGVDFGGDTSVKSAVNAYVELAGATIVGAGSFFAGVFAEMWIDGNLTATGKVAGVMSRCYSSGASTIGNYAAAFMATKQFASTDSWPVALYVDAADYVLYFPTGTNYECGVKVTAITGIDTASSAVMRVMIGATAYYVPLFAAAELDGE